MTAKKGLCPKKFRDRLISNTKKPKRTVRRTRRQRGR